MKFLHTADWHVGKTMKGRNRSEEARAVLDEVAEIAQSNDVDFIIVAGDLFDKSAPSPESEDIVYSALDKLGQIAPVIAVTGNHDNARRFRAIDPLLRRSRVTMVHQILRPDMGGVHQMEIDGVQVKIAMLPFVTKRGIVKMEDLVSDKEAYQNMQKFAERLSRIIEALTVDFDGQSVNLFCGHLFVAGGTMGGGERSAHTVMDYSVPAIAFPSSLNYVALGHLHRTQKVNGKCPIYYAGSPMQLDFGEEMDRKYVQVVDVQPGVPAKVDSVEIRSGRKLRTISGTLEELESQAKDVFENTWLRIRVREPRRPGLADEVRAMFGEQAVSVEIQAPEDQNRINRPTRKGKTPIELFADYCSEKKVRVQGVMKAFEELLAEVKI